MPAIAAWDIYDDGTELDGVVAIGAAVEVVVDDDDEDDSAMPIAARNEFASDSGWSAVSA